MGRRHGAIWRDRDAAVAAVAGEGGAKRSWCAPLEAGGERRGRIVVHAVDVALAVGLMEERAGAASALRGEEGLPWTEEGVLLAAR